MYRGDKSHIFASQCIKLLLQLKDREIWTNRMPKTVCCMNFKFKLKFMNIHWVVLIDNNVPTDLY